MKNQSYLVFHPTGTSPSGLTKRWDIVNLSGVVLGGVSWFAPWRKYVFESQAGRVYDANCLYGIAAFLDKENDHHGK